jgi:hypothetical protein
MSDLSTEQQTTFKPVRGAIGITMGEDFSFIDERDIREWCKDAREHRPPLLTASTAFIFFAGVALTAAPAYLSTDAKHHGEWRGVFLVIALGSAVGCALALLSLIIHLPAFDKPLRKWGLMPPRISTPLERLAERMQNACESGRPYAAAASAALEEAERKKDEAPSPAEAVTP